METVAYLMGKQAYEDGFSEDDNPFDISDIDAYIDWIDGYADARDNSIGLY